MNCFSSIEKVTLSYYGDLFVNTSTLKFFIIDSPRTKFSDEQVILSEFTGIHFSRNEAEALFSKIKNHKWMMSEKLSRDVGLRVAAIDFMENFYQPQNLLRKDSEISESSLKTLLIKLACFYFEAKSKSITF